MVAFTSFGRALYSSIEREAAEQHQEAVTAAAAALQRPDGVRALEPLTAPLSASASAKKSNVVRIDLDEHGLDEADATAQESVPAKPEALVRVKEVLAANSRTKLKSGGRSRGVSTRGDFGVVATRSGAT